jgi:mannose-6-phosphate isomerase-like protein (cupin superfamily)
MSNQVTDPVIRPWGNYMTILGDDSSSYKIKKIVVEHNHQLSLQSHEKRSEHWIIVKGIAQVQIGEDRMVFQKNQSIFIPKGVLHRIKNISDDGGLLEFVEVQIGEYLGEDDITRFEDDYNRLK